MPTNELPTSNAHPSRDLKFITVMTGHTDRYPRSMQAADWDLPALEGTAKQIEWAERIRADYAKAVEKARKGDWLEKHEVEGDFEAGAAIVFGKPDARFSFDRIGSTIRHTRACGVRGVEPMRDLDVTFLREGWADEEVLKEVGIDADEVLRSRQIAGQPELFKNVE